MLNEVIKKEVKKQFEVLKDDVRLVVFTQKIECHYSEDNRILAEEVAGLSIKISVEVSEFPHLGVKYGVEGVPRTVINENISQEGAAPEAMLIEKIKSAVA